MSSRLSPTVAIILAASATPLLAQPANNMRANAIPFGTLPFSASGTTVNATNEGNIAAPCGSAGVSPDVWYRFDCVANTGVTVGTCAAASYDTVIQVLNVGAGGTLGTLIVCDDDGCAGNRSTVEFAAVAGSSYYIRVTGYSGGTGSFTVTATATEAPPPPAPTPVAHPTQTSPTLPTLPGAPTRTVGPDVTIGDLSDTDYYGGGYVWKADSSGVGLSTEAYYGFATGTNSWNIGDVPVQWTENNNLHPVIGQAMYRIKGGRFEQVGTSWLKHGFLSTNSGDFASNCDTPPQGGAQLGVNCSDLYTSGLNGSYSYLGPRFDVNPTTGVYTYPWQPLVGTVANTNNVARRIAVPYSEVSGDVNAGALYLTEGVYITQDDSQWGLSANNYSARILRAHTLFTTPQFFGNTYRRTTALELWARMDNTVSLVPVDFVESTMSITDKWRHWTAAQPDAQVLPQANWVTSTKNQNSRFFIASKAINNGNGTYDYEYAVMNLNSHRSGGSFGVRTPSASSIGFKAPVYHSGERVLNNPWTNNAATGGKLQWNVDPATASYTVPGMAAPVQFNPNALMWGTTYNFRFTSTAAPTTGNVRLGLFRPANATGLQATSIGVAGVKVPTVCTADLGAQGGVAGSDGALDNNDFIAFIDAFFANDMLLADLGAQGGVAGMDNTLNNNDFIVFIDAFFAGCGI